MVLVKEFSHYFPRGVESVAEIKELGKKIKGKYRDAKLDEARGDSKGAIENFNQALEMCEDLRDKLDVFTANRTYIYACEREAERKKDRARERRNSVLVPIACAVVTAVLTAAATFYFTKRHDGAQLVSPPGITQSSQMIPLSPLQKIAEPATKP
jgi:hypothetical protein